MSKTDRDYYSLITYLTNSLSLTISSKLEQNIDWDKIFNTGEKHLSTAIGIKYITDAAKSAVKLFNKNRKKQERFFNYSEDGKQFKVNEDIFLKYINERMPSAYINMASFFLLAAVGESGIRISNELFHTMKQLAQEHDFNGQCEPLLNAFIISNDGIVRCTDKSFAKIFKNT